MVPDLTNDDPRISIGVGTYASGPPLLRPHHPGNSITIGKYCCLAFDVTIFAGGSHPIHYATMQPLKFRLGLSDFASWSDDCGDDQEATRIGNDVWLAHGATILSGVTIGNGAIIGARSVVTKDVPPYAIVGGNAARHIRYRFDQKTIDRLEQIKWWDWPSELITEAAEYLCSPDLQKFFDFADAIGSRK